MKIFVINKNSLFFDKLQKGTYAGTIYKELSNSLLRALRRIHLKLNLPFYYVWYSRDFISPNCNDGIIIFDSLLSVKPANYLKKKYPKLRIIYWHWNHIYNPSIFLKLNDGIERWSYDSEDCKKYNIRFNTQFYFTSYVQSEKSPIERDCFFIGVEKGRGEQIKQCQLLLKEEGLSSLFVVSKNTRKDRERKWVDYDTLINYIASSRCIIDIMPEAQQGMTLRPLEALFHRKKLITNYKGIKSQPFYISNNIFILNEDNPQKLKDFINSPFDDSAMQFLSYFDFNTWLSRFDKRNNKL